MARLCMFVSIIFISLMTIIVPVLLIFNFFSPPSSFDQHLEYENGFSSPTFSSFNALSHHQRLDYANGFSPHPPSTVHDAPTAVYPHYQHSVASNATSSPTLPWLDGYAGSQRPPTTIHDAPAAVYQHSDASNASNASSSPSLSRFEGHAGSRRPPTTIRDAPATVYQHSDASNASSSPTLPCVCVCPPCVPSSANSTSLPHFSSSYVFSTLLDRVLTALVGGVLSFVILVVMDHYQKSTPSEEFFMIFGIICFPLFHAWLASYCFTCDGVSAIISDGVKEFYGNLVAVMLFRLLVSHAERSLLSTEGVYVHFEQSLSTVDSLMFYKTSQRLQRLRVLVWRAAEIRFFDTVLKIFFHLAGFNFIAYDMISFFVLLSASVIAGYALKVFCKALKFQKFTKCVFMTTIIIDILSLQDFLLHKLFHLSSAVLNSVIVVEMVGLAYLNKDLFAAKEFYSPDTDPFHAV